MGDTEVRAMTEAAATLLSLKGHATSASLLSFLVATFCLLVCCLFAAVLVAASEARREICGRIAMPMTSGSSRMEATAETEREDQVENTALSETCTCRNTRKPAPQNRNNAVVKHAYQLGCAALVVSVDGFETMRTQPTQSQHTPTPRAWPKLTRAATQSSTETPKVAACHPGRNATRALIF